MSERTRTETDEVWTNGVFAVGSERYQFFARFRRDDGVPVADAVLITGSATGPGINAAALRALGLSRTAAWVGQLPDDGRWRNSRVHAPIDRALAKLIDSFPDTESAEPARQPRAPLTRPDGTDPEGFARRVAQAYIEAATETSAPAKALAKEAGVPVTTVHRWIRDARRLGALKPARKGAAG